MNEKKTNFDVFESVEEAKEDGTLWGVDCLYLSQEHIDLLLQGKTLKTDNGEYVQILSLEET
jgi:hypothetical protein